ncbi:hypothetical protein QBC38DRAFT_188011 [Podospora fimiseda]|uniref:Uncharacterized protein n=1 Tax=Podospora fimiseda TaxID=252190 RepID=A0AAN7H503_9PEZI|nr:hypothetical protein QBC38DRAFT_188011 [Podospora fimiseda]
MKSLIFTLLLITSTTANVEKTIFLAPPQINIPLSHPTLTDLNLPTLTPSSNSSLRTPLAASFPSPSSPEGSSTWLLLDSLTPSQRYELRICWAATQPTSFTLTPYTLDEVFDTPILIQSLNTYSLSLTPPPTPPATQKRERQSSILLIHIQSQASYFTSNKTLMSNPPPVTVDLILDPFLLNILPRSLLPTILYIIFIALTSLFILAPKIANWVQGIATTEDIQKKLQ